MYTVNATMATSCTQIARVAAMLSRRATALGRGTRQVQPPRFSHSVLSSRFHQAPGYATVLCRQAALESIAQQHRYKSTDTKQGSEPPAPASTTASIPSAASNPKEARLLIGFTCKVCKHRQFKTMSKHAYEKGVVLIQCDSCKNRHLIADNLGWFRDKSINVEDLMREKGEKVRQLKDAGLLDDIEADQVRSALSDYDEVTARREKGE